MVQPIARKLLEVEKAFSFQLWLFVGSEHKISPIMFKDTMHHSWMVLFSQCLGVSAEYSRTQMYIWHCQPSQLDLYPIQQLDSESFQYKYSTTSK